MLYEKLKSIHLRVKKIREIACKPKGSADCKAIRLLSDGILKDLVELESEALPDNGGSLLFLENGKKNLAENLRGENWEFLQASKTY